MHCNRLRAKQLRLVDPVAKGGELQGQGLPGLFSPKNPIRRNSFALSFNYVCTNPFGDKSKFKFKFDSISV